MKKVVSVIRDTVIAGMRVVASKLNKLTHGKLSPDSITIVGVAMHVPIAFLIANGHTIPAAILLVVFGLFDKLDGELARLQGRSSARGMLLDAATDRMKEVMLYTGVAYWFATGPRPAIAAWAVVACGASITVSYVKAKGESAIATSGKKVPHAVLNKLFSDGLLPFELRMVLLIAGLLSGYLPVAVILIAVLASYTALQRLISISKQV